MNVATHSFSLKRICDEVADQNTDLGGQSAQQRKIAAMPFDERKTFAATKEDLEQNIADLPVVLQRQVLVIQKAQKTVDVPLLRYIGTTVDVPVAKQHEDCMTKHNETEMDKKLRSAQFRTESKKQIVFDSECPSDVRFGIRCKQGSRVVRCATLTTSAKTVVRRRRSRWFPGGPSTGAGRAAHRGAQHRRSCARNVSQTESSNRSSMCLCHSILKEIVAVVTLVPHEPRPLPQVVEETMEVVRTIPRSASRSVSPTESSMCQVVMQHQVPTFQTVPRTAEIPQVQFLN